VVAVVELTPCGGSGLVPIPVNAFPACRAVQDDKGLSSRQVQLFTPNGRLLSVDLKVSQVVEGERVLRALRRPAT
jgi:hypothetical protein